MMEQQLVVKVGMADLNVAAGGLLKTTGLGSCGGLTLFDPVRGLGGMAHVMLPSSDIAREAQINVAKYADTAIPELLARMSDAGARLEGAQMFALTGGSDSLRIGPRNVESCTAVLERYRIPILARDTGGNYGRTIELNCLSGSLLIRSVQLGVKEI